MMKIKRGKQNKEHNTKIISLWKEITEKKKRGKKRGKYNEEKKNEEKKKRKIKKGK